MTRISVTAILCAVAFATPAAAITQLNTRTWISGAGTDQSGCGPIANPCRTLQYAHDNTNGGGEIDVKDAAGYGSVTITKAISIVGTGSLAGVLASSGGNGVTINAGSSDKIILRGLTIEGSGVGYNGLVFNNGGTLDIADCIIQNFFATGSGTTGNGILLQPTSGSSTISIVNTTTSNNGSVGVYWFPQNNSFASTKITIDRVTAINNFYGIGLNNSLGANTVSATISNSLVSKSSSTGIYLYNASVSIDLSTSDSNGQDGYHAENGTYVSIGRSVAIFNGRYGINNVNGTVYSYGDNRVDSNGTGQTSGMINSQPLL